MKWHVLYKSIQQTARQAMMAALRKEMPLT